MDNDKFWPLRKRVDDLLHVLVTSHRKALRGQSSWPSPEFRAYKDRHADWLEHPSLPSYRNRVSVQLEDVGTMRARGMVRLVGDRPADKTFDLTAAGLAFHDAHCTRDDH